MLCGVGYAAAEGFGPSSALSSTTKGAFLTKTPSSAFSPSDASADASRATARISRKKPSIWFMSRFAHSAWSACASHRETASALSRVETSPPEPPRVSL